MTSDKKIIYKPHIAQTALFFSLSVFMCFFTYFFFEMRKEVAKSEDSIRRTELNIEQVKLEIAKLSVAPKKSSEPKEKLEKNK